MSDTDRRNLYGKLVDELGIAITGGELPPGERIAIEDLERRYDVSLTVVREAIRVLATKGLVNARPRRGTLVRARNHWHMLDPEVIGWMYSGRPDARFLESFDEVRRIFEPVGARLAATRHTDEDLARLREAFVSLTARHDDISQAIAADVDFHDAIIAAAHNEILHHLAMILEAGLRTRDALVMASHSNRELPLHAAVVEAIASREPDRAEAAMRALLQRSADDVVEVWASATVPD